MNTDTLGDVAQPTNTQFAIAVHVLTLLAIEPEVPRRSEMLGGSADASPAHIRRVLGLLRRARLVRSRPGPHGGSMLTRRADAITLADVFTAVNGDDPVLGIHRANAECADGQTIQSQLVRLEREASVAMAGSLARTTVADLAQSCPSLLAVASG